MIELLGVGMTAPAGGWLVRGVRARLPRGSVTVVSADRAEEAAAVLAGLTARRIPEEGRIWVGRVPVMRETTRRIQALVAAVDVNEPLMPDRSRLWNVLAIARRARWDLLRVPGFPRPAERQAALDALDRCGLGDRIHAPARELDARGRARLAIAGALARRPEYLVVNALDAGAPIASDILALLRSLSLADHLGAVIGLATLTELGPMVDRVLALSHGALVADGPPGALGVAPDGVRLGARVG